jgi:helicase
MLLNWIEEEKEDMICEHFNVGPGDIYRHIETSAWLLYAANVMAKLFNYKDMTFKLEDLRSRVRYGIKEDVLELARLKGVGRIRARNLSKAGFRTIADLKFATVDELSGIRQIGKTVAKEILEQLSKPRREKIQEAKY